MKTLTQVFSYSFGNVVIILAGLVSFPVFTRMLSPSDYGVMSLVNLTVTIMVIFGKCGLQQSLVRYWYSDKYENSTVLSTALFGSSGIAVLLTGSLMIAAFVVSRAENDSRYFILAAIVSALVLMETVKSILFNKMRILQQVARYNIAGIATKYLQIIFAVIVLSYINRTVYGLFAGFVVASLFVLVCIFLKEEKGQASLKHFRKVSFREMLSFGFPLAFYELTNQALMFLDRYLIGYYMGSNSVGTYSAAYNLTYYIQSIMVASVTLVIYPMVVEISSRQGEKAGKEFIRDTTIWFCLFGSAVTFGFMSVGKEIFILMASKAYAEAAVIISPVMLGGFLYGIFTVAAGELFVAKKTRTMALLMGIVAIVNISLNLWLIPSKGILGAAIATLVAEALLCIIGLYTIRALGRIDTIGKIAYYMIPSFLMFVGLRFIPVQISWTSIAVRTVAGFLLWFACSFAMIGRFRAEITSRFAK
ncbi:MAG: oligosaccharide flippase family protein [Deltaproteobacteria bacterium]|nr:oligosaccharide flippase family protein [Deltaproteobacteria bacterium]